MKIFLMVFAIVFTFPAFASPLAQLDCRADNGVELTTFKGQVYGNDPIMVKSQWGYFTRVFEAALEEGVVILKSDYDSYVIIFETLDLGRSNLQSLKGELQTSGKHFVSSISCNVRLNRE